MKLNIRFFILAGFVELGLWGLLLVTGVAPGFYAQGLGIAVRLVGKLTAAIHLMLNGAALPVLFGLIAIEAVLLGLAWVWLAARGSKNLLRSDHMAQ